MLQVDTTTIKLFFFYYQNIQAEIQFEYNHTFIILSSSIRKLIEYYTKHMSSKQDTLGDVLKILTFT